MCRHATLADWTTKSSIWRATSSTPQGPFRLAEMVSQPWSHNAMVAQTFDAAHPYVLYQIGNAVADPSLWVPCFNESVAAPFEVVYSAEKSAGAAAADDCGSNCVYVRSAPALAGPWTALGGNATDAPVPFIFPPGGWATAVNGGNPAPYFFSNGSVLMYFSANPCPPGWGNISPGNNCIGVARGESWAGPFTALPLPVTHPESEDAFVFTDPRGNFHLLTNVNNDRTYTLDESRDPPALLAQPNPDTPQIHLNLLPLTADTRCAAFVECGGHAWSRDGITFSNLTIGAFGPTMRFANGSYWRNAYVERPQVLQADDGTPIAFYVGIGRSSYDDSATWAQLFCVEGQSGCGPTIAPPPPPPVVVQYARASSGLCIGSNSSYPCPGGWSTSCPLFLVPCSDPMSRWLEHSDGRVESSVHSGACWDRDCDDCGDHTVFKMMPCDSATPVAYSAAGGGQLVDGACAGGCVDDGSTGAPTPPCKEGEASLPTQLTLARCTSAATQGWRRIVAG